MSRVLVVDLDLFCIPKDIYNVIKHDESVSIKTMSFILNF